MINIMPVDVDFLYTLKKALNLKIFKDPVVISDFIDILDSELRDYFSLDAIRSFEFLDKDYQFIILIDKNYSDENTSKKMQDVVTDSIMKFCCAYKTAIDVALSDIDRKAMTTFDDCMESGQGVILSGIFQKLDFDTMNGHCSVIRMY